MGFDYINKGKIANSKLGYFFPIKKWLFWNWGCQIFNILSKTQQLTLGRWSVLKETQYKPQNTKHKGKQTIQYIELMYTNSLLIKNKSKTKVKQHNTHNRNNTQRTHTLTKQNKKIGNKTKTIRQNQN